MLLCGSVTDPSSEKGANFLILSCSAAQFYVIATGQNNYGEGRL